jgi:hypothetical protein
MLAAELMGRMGLKARAESRRDFERAANWHADKEGRVWALRSSVADAFCSALNHVREVSAAPNIHSGFQKCGGAELRD